MTPQEIEALIAEGLTDKVESLSTMVELLKAERDALAALLDKVKAVTPEMLRAAQIRSELGAHACSELSGAYSLITEIYTVMVAEFMKQATPQQCLRDIQAEAGRIGFVAGYEDCWRQVFGTDAPEYATAHSADEYAATVRQGTA